MSTLAGGINPPSVPGTAESARAAAQLLNGDVGGAEFHHGGISTVSVHGIRPARVNDRVYRPIDADDPEFRAYARRLAETRRELGPDAVDPIVATADGVIVSGHRRYAAYLLLGVTEVRVRWLTKLSTDPGFEKWLVNFNSQRAKSADEIFREELVRLNPADAHTRLVAHRLASARVKVKTMEIVGTKKRAVISPAKYPLRDAIRKIVFDLEDFWPLSDRGIHYQLLNDPPLKHASKPRSRYRNDDASYEALEILTRMRLTGVIPFEAIGDETRPVVTWDVHPGVQPFIRRELDWFLKQYRRDLQRAQPLHIEIIGEKNTIEGPLRTVAAEYSVPFTIGRGYCSLPPRHAMVERFRASGKDKLLLLAVGDADPEGDDAPHSFARSLRDDFGVEGVEVTKIALTPEQARERALPERTVAKKGSSRRKAFVERHGAEHVWELEALHPTDFQDVLRAGIESVLDMTAFRAEVAAERQDAARLEAMRRTMRTFLVEQIAEFAGAEGGDE